LAKGLLPRSLRTVRGFYVTNDRNYSYVRGYGPSGDYNSRIAVMIDGHRLNDNIFDSGPIGTESPIDIDLIDSVEVIRGPNSSLYVASSFLGVVNIITKRGQDLEKFSVTGQVASYGSYRGRVSYGDKFKHGLQLLLSGSFYNDAGSQPIANPLQRCTLTPVAVLNLYLSPVDAATSRP
jgi:outer membrane cobalamin receptor